MELITQILGYLTLTLNGIGVIIIAWGVLTALYELFKNHLYKSTQFIRLNEVIRLHLSCYLVFSLEFFIASDIVRTMILPSWQTLGILAIIVIIRTILSFFLGKEIRGKSLDIAIAQR